MPEIIFIEADGKRITVQAEENWSVMQVALEYKIKGIEGTCGGTMACATCHIHIHPDWLERVKAEDNEQSEEEKDILETACDVMTNSRLSCQIKVTKALDGLVIAIPPTS